MNAEYERIGIADEMERYFTGSGDMPINEANFEKELSDLRALPAGIGFDDYCARVGLDAKWIRTIHGKMQPRPARIVQALSLVATVAGIVPAVLAYIGIEPVPTLFIPVIIASIPLFGLRSPRFSGLNNTAAGVMTVWCFISGFSVGLFFIPSSLLFLAAAHFGGERFWVNPS